MKQNYLYLIIMLCTYHSLFSMSKDAQDIIRYYDAGIRLKSESPKDALEWFIKAAKIDLPAPGGPLGDPYENARDKKQNAIQEISNIALQLERRQEYDKALEIYQQIPDVFSEQIKKIQTGIRQEQQLAIAEGEASRGNYNAAFQILDKLRNEGYLPANERRKELEKQQQEAIEAERQRLAQEAEQQRLAKEAKQRAEQAEQVRLQQEKRKTALAEAQRLMRDGQYNEALTALAIFPPEEQEVVELRKEIEQNKKIARAKKLAEDNNYAAAYDILTQLKDEGNIAANEVDQELIQKQIRLAKSFVANKNYNLANDIVNMLKAKRPGEKIEEITTIEKEILASKQISQTKEEQERLAAEEQIRQRKIQQEQEQRRKQQEEQKRAEEEAKRRILTKPLDLKSTFIGLNNTLKALASFISAPEI